MDIPVQKKETLKNEQFEAVVSENQFIIDYNGKKVLVTLEEAKDSQIDTAVNSEEGSSRIKVTLNSEEDFNEDELDSLKATVENTIRELVQSIVDSRN